MVVFAKTGRDRRRMPAAAWRLRLHAGIPDLAHVHRFPHPEDLWRYQRDHEGPDCAVAVSFGVPPNPFSAQWPSRKNRALFPEGKAMIRAEPQLVEAARSGDAAAVERLLVVCQPDLRRFARRACSSGEDAEDAVQI